MLCSWGSTACASRRRGSGAQRRRRTGPASSARQSTLGGERAVRQSGSERVCACVCNLAAQSLHRLTALRSALEMPACKNHTLPLLCGPCRRAECYQCQRARSAGARPLAPEEEPPSCIVRVAGLQPQTDEETLRFKFVPHAPGVCFVLASLCTASYITVGHRGRSSPAAPSPAAAPQCTACVPAHLPSPLSPCAVATGEPSACCSEGRSAAAGQVHRGATRHSLPPVL